MIHAEKMIYQENNTVLEGYFAYDSAIKEKRPAVLIMHAWRGRDEFVCNKAQILAELGYVGFAVDVYGKDVLGTNTEENMRLMQPFMEDRGLLRRRLLAGLNAAKSLDNVDRKRIAAIGFCFGGLCALDLARSGADLVGVVSFHGLLNAPDNLPSEKIRAKILALHGHDDPMVSPAQVIEFQTEMTNAHADWQMHIYGNTMHAFTNPDANDPSFGTVYNPIAEKRSWRAMQDFFSEVF